MKPHTCSKRSLTCRSVLPCLCLCLLGAGLLIVLIPLAITQAAATEAPRDQAGGRQTAERTAAPGEFLQQFLSRSLVGESTASPGANNTRAEPEDAAPVSAVAARRQDGSLMAAATKMIVVLAGMLLVLIAGAYGVRRYLLQQTVFSKRNPQLRVVSKIPLTPKTALALVEVPGKLLVVGITPTNLTALSEVPHGAAEQDESPAGEPTAFAETLDQRTQALEEPVQDDEALLHISEAIQRKVRGLKRL